MGFSASQLRMGDVHGNRAGSSTTEAANTGTASGAVSMGIDPGMVGAAGAAPVAGSVVGVILAILFLLVALKFVAKQTGEESKYTSVVPTFYNVLVIALASILGITFCKFLVSKLPSNNALRLLVSGV